MQNNFFKPFEISDHFIEKSMSYYFMNLVKDQGNALVFKARENTLALQDSLIGFPTHHHNYYSYSFAYSYTQDPNVRLYDKDPWKTAIWVV